MVAPKIALGVPQAFLLGIPLGRCTLLFRKGTIPLLGIMGNDLPWRSLHFNCTAVDPDHSITYDSNVLHGVGDKNDGDSFFLEIHHFLKALLLKLHVPDSQDLIDQ